MMLELETEVVSMGRGCVGTGNKGKCETIILLSTGGLSIIGSVVVSIIASGS
jgi:hypothetical protein